jgi:hypothetical protein
MFLIITLNYCNKFDLKLLKNQIRALNFSEAKIAVTGSCNFVQNTFSFVFMFDFILEEGV